MATMDTSISGVVIMKRTIHRVENTTTHTRTVTRHLKRVLKTGTTALSLIIIHTPWQSVWMPQSAPTVIF